MARGKQDDPGLRQVVIDLTDRQYRVIKDLARARSWSFEEMVRYLLDWMMDGSDPHGVCVPVVPARPARKRSCSGD